MRPGDMRPPIPDVADLDAEIKIVASTFGPYGDNSGHDECAACGMCNTCGDCECEVA